MSSVVCRVCGAGNVARARFCLACGAPLRPVAVASERKTVTAVFVDVVGYTELAERLDPEAVAATISPLWERVREELERCAGTVEKFVGDAVLALFGAPVAHEDDAERAVSAALAVRDWARRAGGVHVRIGIATGEALVRLDARPLAGESAAVGDVVNTAARLQQAASVDAVLVDGATVEASRERYEYRRVADVVAKGKARPVPAWEAVRAKADRDERPLSPFVGRATELSLLEGALCRAVEQRSVQLATVVGPPGIGKTRIVAELRELARDVDWLQGAARPYGERGSLAPFAESIRRRCEILGTDEPRVVEDKLERLVATLGLGELSPQLRALVGIAGGDDAVRDATIDAFAAWRRLLEGLAARRPVVLVLEDLQWAEPLLLDFVDHVVDWAVRSPLLVVVTARPELLELRSAWGGGRANALAMTLGPLSGAETESLVASLLGGTADPAVAARSGGNPLYAEQFARMIGEGVEGALPRSVEAVIGARIDALAADEKRALEDAAVVGEVFWPSALGARAGEDTLLRLERKDLIARRRESAFAEEPEYAFRHALVRDVAYARVPRVVRAERHRAAAEWLARVNAEPEALAHQWSSALDAARTARLPTSDIVPQARDALRAAGERAIALNAFDSAAAHLRAAAGLFPADAPARAEVLLRLAYVLAASRAEGVEELHEAIALLQAAGDSARQAEAEALLCELAWYRGDVAESWRHLDAAASLVEDGPATPTKAYVLARLSRQLMLGAAYERAIAVGREAYALAEQLGLEEVRSITLNSIGSARARSGDPEGIGDVERAASISLGATSRAAVIAYNNLASLHGDAGDIRLSTEYLARAEALAAELGDRGYLGWAERERLVLALQNGRWDEVDAAAPRLADEPHYLESLVRCTFALVLQARGDERAPIEIRRGEEAARRVGDPQILLAALADCALFALLDDRRDDADSLAAEVVRLAESTSYLPPAASYPLAVVYEARGDGAELVELLDRFPLQSRWFEAARAYARGSFRAAAVLYGEIGDHAAEAYARVRAGDPRGAAFYASVGAARASFVSRPPMSHSVR